MAFDVGKTPDQYKAISSYGNLSTGIFIGIVKESADRAQYMGRLKVWIPEFGGSGNENDSKFWYTVSYASPFAGTTPVEKNEDDANGKTQQSYGLWMVPPDVGNQVLVCFVNGDTARGFWFACIYPQNMNQMVPAVGVPVRDGKTTDGGVEPVYEYNKKAVTRGELENESTLKRKRFDPLADGLIEQGLDNDYRKGVATTSARRESPSRVFGFLTPRGNSIHIDDGVIDDSKPEGDSNEPDNEFIRLRTRSGVGITIHETDGFVYITSKSGASYLEISDSGINLYTEENLNLRTTSDYNIQSNGDINIDAGGNLNIAATGHIAMGAGAQTYISAGSDLVLGSAGNSSINAGGNLLLTSADVMGFGAGGNSIRQGAKIQDGIDPPAAPLPLAPERSAKPDGRGGEGTRDAIGSSMPHHQPYQPSSTNTEMPTGTTNIPKTIQARAKVLYKILKKKGFSDTQIAAILGVWQQESALNPSAIENGGRGPGVGYAQWTDKVRKQGLYDFAKARGKAWDDPELQVDYFIHELNGRESKAGKMLYSAKTLPQAMSAMKQYERYGIAGARAQYAANFDALLKKDPKGLV